MLYTTLFLAAAAVVSAQNSSNPLPPGINNCCDVPATQVPSDMRRDWCKAQRNTCPEVCGGYGMLAPGGSTCDDTTLSFSCKCRNGTEPDTSVYQQSVPGQMCRFWYDQCIAATNQDLGLQTECVNQRDTKCGNMTTDGTSSSSSSSSSESAGPTATSSGGSSGTSPSTTAASSAAAQSSGAAVLNMARDYSSSIFAGGLLAIFGLAL